MIDYKVSELRATELLDDLCRFASSYTLVAHRVALNATSSNNIQATGAAAPAPAPAPVPAEGVAGDAAEAAAAPAAAAAAEAAFETQLRWTRIKGAGAAKLESGQMPSAEENDLRFKQLQVIEHDTLARQLLVCHCTVHWYIVGLYTLGLVTAYRLACEYLSCPGRNPVGIP